MHFPIEPLSVRSDESSLSFLFAIAVSLSRSSLIVSFRSALLSLREGETASDGYRPREKHQLTLQSDDSESFRFSSLREENPFSVFVNSSQGNDGELVIGIAGKVLTTA
jgi:hypothetical protein